MITDSTYRPVDFGDQEALAAQLHTAENGQTNSAGVAVVVVIGVSGRTVYDIHLNGRFVRRYSHAYLASQAKVAITAALRSVASGVTL